MFGDVQSPTSIVSLFCRTLLTTQEVAEGGNLYQPSWEPKHYSLQKLTDIRGGGGVIFLVLGRWCSLQTVCAPDSISRTWHNQSSTRHWQWSTSCSWVPVYEINSHYTSCILESMRTCEFHSYLWCCPLNWYFSSMRDIVIFIHQIPRHSKVTDLKIHTMFDKTLLYTQPPAVAFHDLLYTECHIK